MEARRVFVVARHGEIVAVAARFGVGNDYLAVSVGRVFLYLAEERRRVSGGLFAHRAGTYRCAALGIHEYDPGKSLAGLQHYGHERRYIHYLVVEVTAVGQ